MRSCARSTKRFAATTSGPLQIESTISSMNRLSNKPSLASSTVSLHCELQRGPHFDAHVGRADHVEQHVSLIVPHGFVLVEQARLDGEARRRMRHHALLDAPALTDREQLGIADVVAAQAFAASSCAITSVVAAPRARPSTL